MAAKIDPGNRYLWRFTPSRLDAEQVRDAMLAVSGELDLHAGGPSTDGNGMRRSIYTLKKRNSQNELLRSLDAPAGFSSTSERQSTTTPTQALLLVNGDWPLARAQKVASRVSSIEEAWQAVLGRRPTAQGMEMAAAFLQRRKRGEQNGARRAVPRSWRSASQFKENTPHERLMATTTEKEGDEFTVEAIVKLDSIDVNASVRTIASRWNNGKDNVEAFGWSLGVTGEKSRFKPRNLIIQLVGEDENRNLDYEPVASDLRLDLGTTYHVAVQVSCSAHTVTFRVQQVGKANAPELTSVVPHGINLGLSQGASVPVIGGVSKRRRRTTGTARSKRPESSAACCPSPRSLLDPAEWVEPSLVSWNAKTGAKHGLDWAGTRDAADSVDPHKQALVDLCHVLLNTNEFFFLH